MKLWKVTGALTLCALALAGCKTEVYSKLNLSDLQNPDADSVRGMVRLEIPSCESYEDSRNPSDSLVKAQEMVPRIFPNAEFDECYSQQMVSWAQFLMPIAIDRTDDGEPASDDSVNLLTLEGSPLLVEVPKALSDRLDQARNANPMMGNLDLSVHVRLTNDTDEPFTGFVYSAWVDDQPRVLGQFELPVGAESVLKLSDVSINQAITQGEATVITTNP